MARFYGVGLIWMMGCPAPDAPPPADPPPPSSTPAVQTSAPSPTPAPAASVGHCAPGQQVWFDCPAAGGKRISLCGGPDPGDAQYRFGPVGSPELSFPPSAQGGKAAFTVEERTHVRSRGTVAIFENEGHRYEVSSYSGGGGGPDAEANNFEGVYVFKGADLLATVPCAGHLTMQLDEWGG